MWTFSSSKKLKYLGAALFLYGLFIVFYNKTKTDDFLRKTDELLWKAPETAPRVARQIMEDHKDTRYDKNCKLAF